MSTTKFMTATGSNRELHIKRSNEDHVQIRQFDPEFHTHQAKTFFLNPSEAPTLALAILEAAGYTEDDTEGTTGLTHFALAMSNLRTGIEEQERATAEARELAELEAEAFEYLKAVYTVTGAHIPAKFSDLNAGVQSHFLIIARRAREMRTEK